MYIHIARVYTCTKSPKCSKEEKEKEKESVTDLEEEKEGGSQGVWPTEGGGGYGRGWG